jgi:hypothetical protein
VVRSSAASDVYKRQHQDLLNAFFMATDTDNDDMRERVIDKIERFNAANPGDAITPKALMASIKRRYEQRALAELTGGARIKKKLIGQLEGMTGFAED